ncbi:MAG TPA: sialate O-acetylesterase [Phycisphaerae bacterium]|nr:sialate O-acetylesterase [Phycisphaerae bacterium]
MNLLVGRGTTVSLMLAALAAGLSPPAAVADVRLPHVIGCNMVLQREKPVPIWGWADPGEEVTVRIAGQEARAKADDKGKWMVRLKAMPAGGPHEMAVAGRNTLQLTNILVGEVWVGSGQSNMEWGIRAAVNGEQEIASADYPRIRLFDVPKVSAGEPALDVNTDWLPCSPNNIVANGGMGFSAALYFFGRELHKELNVPIGLIDSSWGGTRIEPWTPPEGFAGVTGFDEILKQIAEATPNHDQAVAAAVLRHEQWLPTARQALDEGKPVPPPPGWPRHALNSEGSPTGLYNGMIHPLVPFAIRGAIWYQGEANHPDGMKYAAMMKALVTGWRKVWGQGDFPFYYVQIAPYERLYSRDQLPKLWEAQVAAMSIPNTGMIVTTDIADLEDIHPKNKQDVGKRLALWALAKTYGRKDLVCSGPLYKSMKIEDGAIRLLFDYVGSGLASRDGKPLNAFTIAGEDRKFVKADATIDGDTVVIRSDKVSEPKAVRFGWSQLAQPNLINTEGLPASPFRTDRE